MPRIGPRIGMVLDQPFPPDARVEREAVALVEAGFEVHLLCMARETDHFREEVYRGIVLHRVLPEETFYPVPMTGLKTRLPYLGVFRNISRFLWNIDLEWQALMDQFIREQKIEALHIHDLRLVNTGLSLAERYNIPLVADLHENYPALMEMMKGKTDPERGARQRERWEQIERDGVHDADRVLVVIEEAKDRLVAKGIVPEKITVVPNTVDADKFEQAPIDAEVIRQYKNAFLLTYVGHINSPHRGIHTVLEAMGALKGEIPELRFVAAGPVRDAYGETLKAIIDRYGLADRVDFTGWLDETQFVSYIEAADVCLCPHLVTDHTESTFPNKVYLYNLLKKPVIASSCKPLERYIADSGGGITFESGNAADLADKIRILYNNATLRKTLGDNGRRAVLDRYHWRHSAGRVVDVYRSLLGVSATEKALV